MGLWEEFKSFVTGCTRPSFSILTQIQSHHASYVCIEKIITDWDTQQTIITNIPYSNIQAVEMSLYKRMGKDTEHTIIIESGIGLMQIKYSDYMLFEKDYKQLKENFIAYHSK